MSPKAPGADSGDKNEQVKKNFSRTPGLTPVNDYPALSAMIEALHMKHGLPFLKNSGMKLAGSKYWTSCEERPRTLLLVIELHKLDRLRWREIDADARKVLRDLEMEDSCYLRYYIQREPGDARGEIESVVDIASGLDESRTNSSPSERASTPSSLPDLIPISPEEARSATPVSPPLSRQQRRHRRREIAARAQQAARARLERNDSGTTAISRPSAFSTSPSPRTDLTARPNEPRIGSQRRARQPQENPWRPTDEELSRFRNHPPRYTAIVDEGVSTNRSWLSFGLPREWTASGNTWLDYFAASLRLEDDADGPSD